MQIVAYNDGSTVGHAYPLGPTLILKIAGIKKEGKLVIFILIFLRQHLWKYYITFSTAQVVLNSKYRQYFRMSDKQNIKTFDIFYYGVSAIKVTLW